MHKNLLLAFGITILFLGIAIQPAVAVNPISSDNEEDCSICPKVSKPHLVRLRSLINRVETLNNKLFVLSKLNPIVAERYQELSERIRTLKEMNKDIKPDFRFPIICGILFILMLPFAFIDIIANQIAYSINPDSFLWNLLLPFLIIGEMGTSFWIVLMVLLDCVELYL